MMPRIIFVRHEGRGGRRSYMINASDTVESLKADIEQAEGVPVDRQTLFCGNKELVSLDILPENSIVTLRTALPIIFVQTQTGKSLAVSIRLDSTFTDLMHLIQQKEGIPAEKQRLFFRGQLMMPQYTLRSCEVEHESTLLVVRLREEPPPPPIKTKNKQIISVMKSFSYNRRKPNKEMSADSRNLGRSRDFGSSLTMVAGSRLNSARAMWRKFVARFSENVRDIGV